MATVLTCIETTPASELRLGAPARRFLDATHGNEPGVPRRMRTCRAEMGR